jgi:hypothetical protein
MNSLQQLEIMEHIKDLYRVKVDGAAIECHHELPFIKANAKHALDSY